MAERMFHVEVVAPDRVCYEGDASMIELNTTEGEIGVYPGHIPMTLIVAPGTLVIHEAGGKKEAGLISGFLEIQSDKVTILAEMIDWPES